jgi:hypothetical protein
MSNETETELPAGMLAMLLAEPPADLLGLALRRVPVDTEQACRIAALHCAMMRGGVDLTAKRPAEEQAFQVAEYYREWLRDTRDTSAGETTLRIYVLHFAIQMTPPDTAFTSVLRAADLLHKWFAGGKLSRGWGAR